MTSPIAAVVFDQDGPLFDYHGSATRGVAGLVDQLGAQFTPDLTAAWFAAEDQHVQSWVSGNCSWQEQRRRRLQDFLPLIGIEAVADETASDSRSPTVRSADVSTARATSDHPNARKTRTMKCTMTAP